MATFYGTEAGFTTYTTAYGYTVPAGDVEQALLRGSLAIDALYGMRFPGTKSSYAQEREWPRTGAQWPDGTAISGTPEQVEWATYEAALQELTKPGSLLPIVTPGKVRKRERVEGAISVEYFPDYLSSDLVESLRPVLTKVDAHLQHLVGTRSPLPGILVV